MLVVVATAALGCARTVTENDCLKIKDNLKEAWAIEAKNAMPADGTAKEKAASVIRTEGERLVTEWVADCNKGLVGRSLPPQELACMLDAKTFAQIQACAEH